jgi:hypothetical protein
MNHLGDTNKMVSETPRTNQVSIRQQYGDEWDWCRADFARQLERELNAANDRIKRLEEAHSWRLIETAPSDYTWILGYDEKHGETGMIIFERGDESEPHWTDGMREWEPTHWMPLPEEPKAKECK